MPVRLRRFIGMILLVTLVLVYVLIVAIIAMATLGGANVMIQFAYFAFTGLLWVLPAMLIVKWMYKPPKNRSEA